MLRSLMNRRYLTAAGALALPLLLAPLALTQTAPPRGAPRPASAAARAATTTLRFALPPGETLTIDPNSSFTDPSNPKVHAMDNPRLLFIFYGPTWPTAQGRAREKALLQATRDMIDSGYFGGLAQYGFGKLTFNPAADFIEEQQTPLTILRNLPRNDPNVNARALQAFLATTLARLRLRLPQKGDNWRNATLYVVVGDTTSPGTQGAVRYGENDPWRLDPNNARSAALAEMLWIGWDANQPRGPRGEYDGTTALISHELAEAISGVGLRVQLPPGRQSNGNQICDNDAATHLARLIAGADGQQVLVQSYYSDAERQFIIPGVPAIRPQAGRAPR